MIGFAILLKRQIFSMKMLLSVVLSLALMLYPVISDFLNIMCGRYDNIPECMYFIDRTQTMSVFPLFAPIIAVLPSASIFCDDYKSMYIRSVVSRIGKTKYLISNYTVCAVSGGLALLVSELITFCICGFFTINSNFEVIDISALNSIAFYELYGKIGTISTAIILLLLGFLFGAIWGGIGITVSLFITNNLAAYSIPFLIYFAVSMLMSGSDILIMYSPINYLYPSLVSMPSISFCFVVQLIFLVIVTIIYAIKGRKNINVL